MTADLPVSSSYLACMWDASRKTTRRDESSCSSPIWDWPVMQPERASRKTLPATMKPTHRRTGRFRTAMLRLFSAEKSIGADRWAPANNRRRPYSDERSTPFLTVKHWHGTQFPRESRSFGFPCPPHRLREDLSRLFFL